MLVLVYLNKESSIFVIPRSCPLLSFFLFFPSFGRHFLISLLTRRLTPRRPPLSHLSAHATTAATIFAHPFSLSLPPQTFFFVSLMDNFEAVLEKEWNMTNLKVLTTQIKAHDSVLRLKRRWLMDLPLSTSEQKRVEEILPPNDKIMPESLLREDDVSYEDTRTCIEMGFGADNCGKESHFLQKDVRLSNSHDGFRHILFLLDDMTNKDLCSFTKILTGGVIKFEKTSWSMKRTIKELLPKVISDNNDISKAKLKQILQLVEGPKSYCGNQTMHSNSSEAYHAAALKVLNGLEDFPSKILNAMYRKLRGVSGYIPSMQSPISGRGRDKLISLVKKRCMKMLADLGEMGEPSKELAGALGVAGLTLKLIMNRPAIRDFRKFSPKIEALQNDIAKAIHLLNDKKKVSLIELRKVQVLLDPNSQLSVRSLRMAIRNLLTEYLFECGDMDMIPDYVIETLDVINRRSQRRHRKKHSSSKIYSSSLELKEAIEKEVEYVLTTSADAKEVVLGLQLKHEFDQDFARAYMEDFEGSDSLCISGDDEQVGDLSQHYEFHSYSSYGQTESIGETNPVDLDSPVSTSERVGCSTLLSPKGRSKVPLESMHITDMDSDACGFSHSQSCKESKFLDDECEACKHYPSGCIGKSGLAYSDSLKVTSKQKLSSLSPPARDLIRNDLKNEEKTSCSATTLKYELPDIPLEETNNVSQQSRFANLYLEIQEACDDTTMVAYHFVGHVLDKLAKIEGLELCQDDRLYLRSYSSVPEDSEEV